MDSWKRIFLRPDGALQEGKVWLGPDQCVEVEIKLREAHQVMPTDWRDRAHTAVERAAARGEIRGNVLFLDIAQI